MHVTPFLCISCCELVKILIELNDKKWVKLLNFYPQLNWKQYFNNILSVTSYQVNESEPIIVKEPEFLGQLSRIVLQMMTTADGRR